MRGRRVLTACPPGLGDARGSHYRTFAASSEHNMPSHDDAAAESSKMVCCGCSTRGSRDQALWRVTLAELCGSALLVLLSCLPGCGPAGAYTPMHRAIAGGFVVTVLVQTLDHISGAFFNPTVLLAAVLYRRVTVLSGIAILAAQVIGGVIGGGALYYLQPPETATCVTVPAENLAIYQAVGIEAVLSGCLALANCGAWDARNDGLRDSWPLRIGITVAGLSLAGGELTGASMNPVRSLGPALWSGNWTHHWVYWVGPLSGSLASTLCYLCAWRARHDELARLHRARVPGASSRLYALNTGI